MSTTALVNFSVEDAKSLEELVHKAEIEAKSVVDDATKATFHSAKIVSLSGGRIQGDFTYEVAIP
jgi:hypothetical protein